MNWVGCATFVQGNSHAAKREPCQDRALFRQYDNGVSVVALADGAGSARHSHFGAELAISIAAQALADKLDKVTEGGVSPERFGEWLVEGLQWELLRLAQRGVPVFDAERRRYGLPEQDELPLVPCEIGDLASTLLAVAVKDDSYMCLHLGDGVVGASERVLGGNLRLRVLSHPDNGEYSNETVFTTSPMAKDSLHVYAGKLSGRLRRINGFILMSDGPEAALYDKREGSLAGACAQLLSGLLERSSDEMKLQMDTVLIRQVMQRTSDDCSVALMVAAER